MVWFFERDSQRLHLEIRRELAGQGYELVISDALEERVEKVSSPSALLDRSHHVWAGLLKGGWRPLQEQGPAL